MSVLPRQGGRDAYYTRIARAGMSPLWESMHALVPSQPTPRCTAVIWKYAEVRDCVLEAGTLISAQEAVRRVLMLENPGLPGQASVTSSLYAGLQLILPGESAPSHRHTQSALRFILEGQGAWSTVDGERTTMRPGDFIITPAWTWHEHGNLPAEQGGEPVVWLDGLDIPLVRFLDAGFAQTAEQAPQPPVVREGTHAARYGYNLGPVRAQTSRGASPLSSYPYERSRQALENLLRYEAPDQWDGLRLRYVDPTTGGWPMPTMGAFLQLLPAGFAGRVQRSSDSTVYCVAEGRGTARVGEFLMDFEPRDIFVVPSWSPLSLNASESSVLFSFSDRPVQEALGLWREERL